MPPWTGSPRRRRAVPEFGPVSGAEMAWFARNQTSQGMQLPVVWPYVGVPIFFVLAAIFAVANLLPQRPRDEAPAVR